MTWGRRATRSAVRIGAVSGILGAEVFMYQPLVPCPSCQRHVLAAEATCPFCAAILPSDLGGRVIPGAPQRLGRAAAFVFGASLAVTACASSVSTGSSGSSESTGASGAGGGGPDDDGGIMAHYGNPGFDAGDDDGGGMTLYGLPPPPDDAGPDASDAGGNMGIYGSPPPPPKGV
jgi:hypothetical protein